MCKAIIVYNSFDFNDFITNLILLSKVEHNNIKVAVYTTRESNYSRIWSLHE
jgi:hypothetical protein